MILRHLLESEFDGLGWFGGGASPGFREGLEGSAGKGLIQDGVWRSPSDSHPSELSGCLPGSATGLPLFFSIGMTFQLHLESVIDDGDECKSYQLCVPPTAGARGQCNLIHMLSVPGTVPGSEVGT